MKDSLLLASEVTCHLLSHGHLRNAFHGNWLFRRFLSSAWSRSPLVLFSQALSIDLHRCRTTFRFGPSCLGGWLSVPIQHHIPSRPRLHAPPGVRDQPGLPDLLFCSPWQPLLLLIPTAVGTSAALLGPPAPTTAAAMTHWRLNPASDLLVQRQFAPLLIEHS